MDRSDLTNALTKGAVYSNSSTTMDPWVNSTGFRTASLAYRTLGLNETYPRVAEDFLINTRLVRGDAENTSSIQYYFEEHTTVMLSRDGQENIAESIPLPKNIPIPIDLGSLIPKRRSVRKFTGDRIGLDYLATIIRLTAGISAHADVQLVSEQSVTLRFRVTPSGGGLYPVDVYMAINRVEGIEPGFYRYRPGKDDLVRVQTDASFSDLLSSVSMPEDMLSTSKVNAVFLLVARPWKSMRKYGGRGMRFVFMETGMMAEHIHLASAALGLGSCDCASIYDEEVHRILHIDGIYEALTHAVLVGCPV